MKTLNKKNTRTEVNLETGEINRIITDEFKGYIDQEPDYIKIYIGTQLCLNKLDPNLAPIIIAFSPYMSYANDSQYTHMIMVNETVFEYVAQYLNISVSRARHLPQKLVESGIFIPILKRVEKDGIITTTKKRGQYFVNPWVVAKGSWKDIKQLQQNIDFVKGSSSYFIEDEIGGRKIQCNIPSNYQFSLADFGMDF